MIAQQEFTTSVLLTYTFRVCCLVMRTQRTCIFYMTLLHANQQKLLVEAFLKVVEFNYLSAEIDISAHI